MIGVFEFILLIVLISTIGKVITARVERPALRQGTRPEDINLLNEAMSDLSTRLAKLEEERDFYRALLEPPERGGTRHLEQGAQPGPPPPTSSPGSSPGTPPGPSPGSPSAEPPDDATAQGTSGGG